MNIIGIIGLLVAMGEQQTFAKLKIKLLLSGWYLIALGFWSMLYDPIHFAAFMIILFLLPVLLYTSYVLYGLYLMLSEAYIDVSILEYS